MWADISYVTYKADDIGFVFAMLFFAAMIAVGTAIWEMCNPPQKAAKKEDDK